MATAPCPLCGSSQREVIATQNQLVLQGSDGSGALSVRPISYLACPRCGTVSQDPLPPNKQVDRFYAASSLEVGGPTQRAAFDALNQWRVELLRTVCKVPKGACLDVGAAGCSFAQLVRTQLGLEPWCLEPCPPDQAPSGIHLVRGTLENIAPGAMPATFPVVTCFSVLEHVPDPGAFLPLLAARLEPGGLLMLQVPSGELLAQGISCAYGQNIYSLHLHHFSAAGLTRAMTEHGLELVRISDELVAGYPLLTIIARRQDPRESAVLFRRQFEHQRATAAMAFTKLADAARIAATDHGRILVWGAGIDVFEMVEQASGPWPDNCDLFDRNAAKQGRTLAGISILCEADIVGSDYSLILAGTRHEALTRAILEDAAKLFPETPRRSLFEDQEKIKP